MAIPNSCKEKIKEKAIIWLSRLQQSVLVSKASSASWLKCYLRVTLMMKSLCSNPQYSWVTYFILSNFLKLFPACLIYSPLVALSIFVTLSIFRRLIKLLAFSHTLLSTRFFIYSLIYVPYKCTCCTHHKHNSYSHLIVRTLCAPIYLSNSPGVFGHCAILILGGSSHGWGFPHRTNRYVSTPFSGTLS